MSEDHEERGRRRRADVLRTLLKAGDAGEILSVPELKARLSWGGEITKHGLLWIVNTLEEGGYLTRGWGKELGPKAHGKTSYIVLKAKAYETRAGR